MRKKVFALIASVILLICSVLVMPADAAVKETSYKNCKALNAVYPNGVMQKAGTKNKVVNQKTKKATYKTSKAYASASLYKLNKSLDNDGDGIACEK